MLHGRKYDTRCDIWSLGYGNDHPVFTRIVVSAACAAMRLHVLDTQVILSIILTIPRSI